MKVPFKRTLRFFLLLFFLICEVSNSSLGAEYLGEDLDGQIFSGTAYSYSTGRYYNVSVEFSGDEVIIYFRSGGSKILTLDDEDIEDIHDISAYDYKSGTYWEIDVDY